MIIHLRESTFHRLLTEATTEEIYQKYYSDIPYQTYCRILLLDPTYNNGRMGKYTKWLLNIYRTGKFKEGDFNEARKYLPVYDKYKNAIQVKDIMTLKSMGELYRVVEPYLEGNKATSKSDATRRTKEDAEKVYEDNQWLIIIPHTMKAAQLYGKHTKWCTAAEKSENMFDSYNEDGPLYINIDKVNNRKYQFHFESGQFMDENDDPLEKLLPNDGVSIADIINLSDGAKEYYYNSLGDKANYLLLSEREDLEQSVAKFNSLNNVDIKKRLISSFKEASILNKDGDRIRVNVNDSEGGLTEDMQLAIIEHHGKSNAVNLASGRLILDRWVDSIFVFNDGGADKLFINACKEDFDYPDFYILFGGKKLVKADAELEAIDYDSEKNPKCGFINAASVKCGSGYVKDSDVFISKETGKAITRDELRSSFIEFVEKNNLLFDCDYPPSLVYNENSPLIYFEKAVLGLNREKYEESTFVIRLILKDTYIEWKMKHDNTLK